jgi:hypothetical protein
MAFPDGEAVVERNGCEDARPLMSFFSLFSSTFFYSKLLNGLVRLINFSSEARADAVVSSDVNGSSSRKKTFSLLRNGRYLSPV